MTPTGPDDEGGAGEGGMDDELLIEQVAGAWRPAASDAVHFHKAWHDLGPAARVRAHDRAAALRPVEAALDPDGLSTTARAVLARIARRP